MSKKGLKDIKTMRDVSKSRPAPQERTIGKPKTRRTQSWKYQPRTWVFTGEPQFERFHRRSDEAERALLVDKVKEPHVDIFEETESVVVIADLTGVEEKGIELNADGDILLIDATAEAPNGKRKYSKEVLIPFEIDTGRMDSTFKNGILEVTLYNLKIKRMRRSNKDGQEN